MQNTSYSQAENLVFLTRQFWLQYFSNTNPTAANIDNIARGYDNIQQWFAVLEFYGEKLIAETDRVEMTLNGEGNV
jgi:hypothetical protein